MDYIYIGQIVFTIIMILTIIICMNESFIYSGTIGRFRKYPYRPNYQLINGLCVNQLISLCDRALIDQSINQFSFNANTSCQNATCISLMRMDRIATEQERLPLAITNE